MKNQLKEQILEKRNLLPKEEIAEKSRQIEKKVFNLRHYKNSKAIMFFVSFNSEVCTHDMIKKSLKEKTVIVPKVAANEIEPSIIIDFDSLLPSGRFGVLEPVEAAKITHKNIGLVLVPGIVFDKGGHRIGYGLGYYDRFLRKVPKAVKVGIAFDFQVVERIPREMHDVPVDMIVTDKRVIECNRDKKG